MSSFSVFILTIIFILIFFRFKEKSELLILILLLSFHHFIFAIGNISATYLRSYKIFAPWILKDQIVAPVTRLIFIIIFVKFLDLGVLGQSLSYALTSIFSFFLVIYFLIPFIKKQRLQEDRPSHISIKGLVKSSFPLGVMNGLELIMFWMSVTLAGSFLTAKEAALITVCITINLFVLFLFNVFQPIFSPYIADSLRTNQFQETKNLYQTVNYWSAKWGILAVFLIAIVSKTLLNTFGPEFSDAKTTLLLVLPGFLVEAMFGASKQGLIMGGIRWSNAIYLFLAILVNIIVSFLLMNTFHLNGIAVALSLSFLTLNFLRVVRFYISFGILPMNKRHFINLSLIMSTLLFLGCSIETFLKEEWQKTTLGLLIFTSGFILGFWKDGRFLLQQISGKWKTLNQDCSSSST